MRWWRPISMLAVATVVLTGCSGPFPPHGIALVHGTPTIIFKMCDQRRTIGRLTLGEVHHGDVVHARIVWTARLVDQRSGARSLPVRPQVPGYHVVDHLRGGLAHDGRYVVVEATDEDGVNLVGTLEDFRARELREGRIISADDTERVSAWLGRHGPTCH